MSIKFISKLLVFFLIDCGFLIHAGAEGIYRTPDRITKDTVKFSVPYTFGVHQGVVSQFNGFVRTNSLDEVIEAHFKVPIESMSTGNRLRDCHMREALGLNYDQSQFPAEHICSNSNTSLPSSGPDSIQYPSISLDFINMSPSPKKEPFEPGIPKKVSLSVAITIHGVTKIHNVDSVTIIKNAEQNGQTSFRIQTQMNLSLKDFGVVVKALKLGPISMTVEDKITIDIDTTVRQ